MQRFRQHQAAPTAPTTAAAARAAQPTDDGLLLRVTDPADMALGYCAASACPDSRPIQPYERARVMECEICHRPWLRHDWLKRKSER